MNQPPDLQRVGRYAGIGLVLGIMVGVVVGTALESIGVASGVERGFSFGLIIGMVIGAAWGLVGRSIRKGFLAPVREKLIMPQWMRDLLCGLGWGHIGTWAYDKGPHECNQTRICLRCGEKSSRFEHAVEPWLSNGFFCSTESGVCIRCERRQTRRRDGLG